MTTFEPFDMTFLISVQINKPFPGSYRAVISPEIYVLLEPRVNAVAGGGNGWMQITVPSANHAETVLQERWM